MISTLFKEAIATVAAVATLVSSGAGAFAQTVLSEGSVQPMESSNTVITVYSEADGLPTGEANTVLQTSDGYIWIGSYGGLIRYDGEHFRNYSAEGLIDSSSIRSLFEDSYGRLWIGTNDKGVYLMEDDTIGHIPCAITDDFLCIRDFAESLDGRIIVASTSGLGEVNNNSMTLMPYENTQIHGEPVYSIAIDSFNRIWASINAGRCYVVQNQSVVMGYEPDDFFSDGVDIYSVANDYDNNIYLGSYGDELVKISFTEQGSESLAPDSLNKETFYTGTVQTHNQLNVSPSNDILVSGIAGFGVFDTETNSFTEYNDAETLSSINWATVDYEGNIWLASTSQGVIKLTQGCFENYNSSAALTEVSVNAVHLSGGCFYIATDTGLIICDSNWGRVDNSLTELLHGIRIRQITTDSQGNIWIATYSEYGAVKYNPESEETEYFDSEKGVKSDKVRVIESMQNGDIVIGAQRGLTVVRDGKVIKTYDTDNGFAATAVLCMMELGGSLFVGTDGSGIYEITNEGEIKVHSYSEGLLEGVVLRMCPDPDNMSNYFVSAGSSLYYFDSEAGSFRKLDNFTKGPGSIYDFYVRMGKLWILQNNGIISVDKNALLSGKNPKTRTYGVEHGLTGTLNANTWNSYNSNSDLLYVATRSGVSIFSFTEIPYIFPKGIINSVSVDNTIIEHPETVSLKKDAQRITIDFSALTYTGTTPLNIGYTLEGFDSEEFFVTDSNNALVSYTNLPGGKYYFKVRIFDPVTGQTLSNYTLIIEKDKKLTEYALFWVLLVVGIFAAASILFLIIFKAKTKHYEKHQRELQSIVDLSLKTTAKIIDAKDEYTNGHSIRVAYYSRELAREMGFSDEEQKRIYSIALLHDIGKIGVPDSILNKPSRLTDEEFSVIKEHVTVGGEILEEFSVIKGIQDGAKYHHERYDGNGYCENRSGESIPLVARIICVADSYDAMQSTRCYRDGLSTEKIIEELKNGAGTQFDPDIVPHMLSLIENGIAPLGF